MCASCALFFPTFLWAQIDAKSVDANLTAALAQRRAALIKNTSYKIHIKLDQKKDFFTGDETVKFHLTESGKDIHLDFKYGKVDSLTVNSIRVAQPEHTDHRIRLSSELLKLGTNEVRVQYTQKYSTNGAGLYRFKDPEDGAIYIYSMFEPYDANFMFPCFDQPDIKANFSLSVEAPKEWVVISAGAETKTGTLSGMSTWSFEETPQISPYIFSLHAGPYKMWTSKAGDIPLRLFSRKSLAKYVRTADWFEPTQHGFNFFAEYFNYPYPFKKYDQIIVPDFNFGAMENLAAVTFAERYVRRGSPTILDRERLASTILHELAHMWFGNLVTMRWWNGLWLNESFATYMSALALVEIKDFKNAWLSFNGTKSWAYWEDQLVTTHPIEGAVLDTLTAFVNFDGITYGKGASVLKQIHYFIGDEAFKSGLRLYFQAHEYGNTEIRDFINALATSSRQNLNDWSKLWLEKAGLDTVRVEADCVQGRVQSFELIKTPPRDEPAERAHRTIVAIFDIDKGRLVKRKSVSAKYQLTKTSLLEFKGERCPDFIYPNFLDHDYVKVELDQKSLTTAKSHLSGIEDVLLRTMIWANLIDMVKDAKLSADEYAQIVSQHIENEKSIPTLKMVLDSLHGRGSVGMNSLLSYYPDNELMGGKRKNAMDQLELAIWKKLSKAATGSDEQKILLSSYAKLSESPVSQSRLLEMLKTGQFNGFKIDKDLRWAMIRRLHQNGHPKASGLLTAEKKSDPSEQGVQEAIAAEVSVPNLKVKQDWLTRLGRESSESLGRQKAAMNNMFPAHQEKLKSQMLPLVLDQILVLMAKRDQEFMGTYAESLIPRYCEAKSVEILQSFLKVQGARLSPSIIKPLRIHLQEDQRCLLIREKLAENTSTGFRK
jgi:aminopeptidase N